MEDRIAKLEEELQKIHERNAHVETNKAWEMSTTRILTIALFTYIVAVITLGVLGASYPLYSAFLPVIGFYLSTLSLPYVRRWWQKKYHSNFPKSNFHAED